MGYKKQVSFFSITILVLLAGLQGCSTKALKQGSAATVSKPSRLAKAPQLSDADTLKLFQKGSYVNLVEMGRGSKKAYVNGKIVDKPIDMKVSSNPLLRQTIVSTPRGKVLTACQFRALRIELDGKKATTDWLVTTKGKGARCDGDTRYFWIIQQGNDSTASAQILLKGRASSVGVKAKNSAWSEVSVSNRGDIKIKNGDKLADGSYVQVESSDNDRVEISCRSSFRLQGKQYKVHKESVEANVNTAMMSGKSWQPVNDPRYRCPF